MIKRLTFLVILFSLANLSYPQGAWSFLGNIPSGADINSISVVDQNVMFVAAKGNYLYRTLNGGATWELKNTGLGASGDLYGISATDSLNCWVGWLKTTGTPASIYRTTNGGTSWTSQWSLAGSFPDGIKMFTPSYGIAIADPTASGQPYQFRYTTNGGSNWYLSPTSPIATSEFGVINAFDFIDTNIIWVGSANTITTGTTAKIYRTSTGINGTWSNTAITGTAGSSGLYYQAIGFIDKNNGLAGSSEGDIVKSTDGGATWTAVPPPAGLSVFSVINMFGFKDGSNLIRMSVVDATAYRCFSTTDFGTTWTEEVLPAEGSASGIQHMQFVDGNLGFAGGLGGTMLKYTGTLPVELTSFTAKAAAGNVTLSWKTASEINNSGFEIQRKADENNWLVIAFKNGNGTTTNTNDYVFTDNIAGLNTNKLSYRLRQLDFNGHSQFSPIVLVDNLIPVNYSISQNFPNPFNPSTIIKFQIPQNSFVNLTVYNSLGQEIASLVNGIVDAGTHEVQFNASNISSGIYFYVIKAGNSFVQTKKMIVIK
jgi:photosystem II stability/assembly factor-like uncharacterized protein